MDGGGVGDDSFGVDGDEAQQRNLGWGEIATHSLYQ